MSITLKSFLTLLFCLFTSFSNTIQAQKRQALPLDKEFLVIAVKDGDSYALRADDKNINVRLAHIDCPEKRQDYGNKAKQFASNLAFQKRVKLIHQNKYDRNGRLIAEIVLKNGQNLNQLLVKNGLAWHYKQYSKSNYYAQLELSARKSKVGLWSMKNPTAPWLFRKQKRAPKSSHN